MYAISGCSAWRLALSTPCSLPVVLTLAFLCPRGGGRTSLIPVLYQVLWTRTHTAIKRSMNNESWRNRRNKSGEAPESLFFIRFQSLSVQPTAITFPIPVEVRSCSALTQYIAGGINLCLITLAGLNFCKKDNHFVACHISYKKIYVCYTSTSLSDKLTSPCFKHTASNGIKGSFGKHRNQTLYLYYLSPQIASVTP